MAVTSKLIRDGIRAGLLGDATTLVYAAPIAAGDLSPAANTHAARTGWYHPTATSTGFVTNGSERLRLWGDGGVSIGGAYAASPGTGNAAVAGDFYVGGKLTVVGLIDPTGLQLVPQAANPGDVNTLWIDSVTSKTYVGPTNAIVTAVNDVATLTGLTLTAVAANPGGVNTIWYDTTSGKPKIGIADTLLTQAPGGTVEVVGPLQINDGSLTAPAYSFSGETNSGLLRAGAGQLSVAVLGVSQVSISSTQVTVRSLSSAASTLVGASTTGVLSALSYVPASNFPALTGDVTTTAGSLATAIATGAVTLAKMAALPAGTLIGNNTVAPATPLALTSSQVKTLLAIAASDVSGLTAWATKAYPADAAGLLRNNGAGVLSWDTSVYLTANQTIALSGDVTGSGTTAITATIAANAVTYAKFQQVAASSLVGNPTGAPANVQGVTLGGPLSFSGTTLTIAAGAIGNSYLANSSITIAGNSTALGGSVTQDQITGLSATGIIKRTGPNTLAIAVAGSDYLAPYGSQTANTFFAAPNGAPGLPTFRTIVPADLPVFTSTTAGIVPASGGGTVNFLRADGTWTAPNYVAGTLAANQVAFGSGSNTIQGSSTFTYNGTTLNLSPAPATTGSPSTFSVVAAAHTTLTASVEAIDLSFNLARTVQFNSGLLATQRAIWIQAPTYAFTAASTITTAATLAISGAPIAGTNATITTAVALDIESGLLRTAASTTATAGLRVPAGTAPTSPVNGDVWETTAGLWLRMNGATVGPINSTILFSQTQTVTVTGTTASTLLGTGVGSVTIPANYLTAGKKVRITATMSCTRPSATFTATVTLTFGTWSQAFTTTTSSGTRPITFIAELTPQAAGASVTIAGHLISFVGPNGGGAAATNVYAKTAAAFNTTAATTLVLTGVTSQTAASVSCDSLTIESLFF